MIKKKYKKTVFTLILCTIFFAVLSMPVKAADIATYSTEGGTWEQINSNTWSMDKDGDGNPDVTLLKEDNEWKYMFTVLDDSARYYAWESSVPDGYEVEETGTRVNPALGYSNNTIITNKSTDNPAPEKGSLSLTKNVDLSANSVYKTVTKYSHTPNISDDGTKNSNYTNNMSTNEVVTIPGASSLHVSITYSGESTSYDWACMWSGNHPEYTAYSNFSASITGKLGGTSRTTKEYDVEGDTVTFGYRSDGGGFGDGYGYYAVITGEEATFPDEYLTQNFKFTINLLSSDAKIQPLLSGRKTFGNIVFNDGVGEVNLQHGQTAVFDDIPEGVTYIINENDNDKYTKEWSGSGTDLDGGRTGTITANATESVICTNVMKKIISPTPMPTNNLNIRKEVVNGNDTDEFDFHTTFWGLEPNKEYTYTTGSEETTFKADIAGSADISYTLSNGKTAVFKNIPVGCQYQTTEDASNYIVSYHFEETTNTVQPNGENLETNKSITTAKESLDGNETVVFVNTGNIIIKDDTTTVHVEKIWNDSNNAAGLRPNNIKIQLMQDDDMIATALLDESNNWTADFTGLDIYHEDKITKYNYTIREVEVPGYTSEIASAGDIDNGLSFIITNTAENVGNLKVTKYITGVTEDLPQEFKFSIQLTKNSKPVTGTYNLDSIAGTKTGTIRFDENGSATFTLKNNNSIVIANLPSGAEYAIEEEPVKNYTASDNGKYSGTIGVNDTKDVEIYNTLQLCTITVNKTVKGNQGDKKRDFNFQLIDDKLQDNLKYTKTDNSTGITETGEITIENGAYKFTLAHNQSISFENILLDSDYKISEIDGESSGYDVQSENASGTVTEDISVSFINTKNVGIPTGNMANTLTVLLICGVCIIIILVIYTGNKKIKK